jgi:hypothetical protein
MVGDHVRGVSSHRLYQRHICLVADQVAADRPAGGARAEAARNYEGYSGIVPRRYFKETLIRIQRLIESRGL